MQMRIISRFLFVSVSFRHAA